MLMADADGATPADELRKLELAIRASANSVTGNVVKGSPALPVTAAADAASGVTGMLGVAVASRAHLQKEVQL